MRINIFFILLFIFSQDVLAQVGGQTIFGFLELPSTARATALGGRLITVSDDDGALAYHNPAVLSDSADGQISFNYNFLFGSSRHGLLSYSHHLDSADLSIGGQIKFMQYGEIIERDIQGNTIGVNSNPQDIAITLTASKPIYDRLSLGANVRFIQSSISTFSSTGIGLDLGAFYHVPEKGLSIALVANHIGTQLSSYAGTREPMPTNVQLALSKRLKHMPFRFTVTAHHLNRWDLQYDNPFDDDGTFIIGETPASTESNRSTVDNIFRHLIFSGEFLLGKAENLRLRLGYNHMIKQDLSVTTNSASFAGFFFGFGLKVSKFRFDYGRGVYHIAGGAHHITISTALSEFGKKR